MENGPYAEMNTLFSAARNDMERYYARKIVQHFTIIICDSWLVSMFSEEKMICGINVKQNSCFFPLLSFSTGVFSFVCWLGNHSWPMATRDLPASKQTRKPPLKTMQREKHSLGFNILFDMFQRMFLAMVLTYPWEQRQCISCNFVAA